MALWWTVPETNICLEKRLRFWEAVVKFTNHCTDLNTSPLHIQDHLGHQHLLWLSSHYWTPALPFLLSFHTRGVPVPHIHFRPTYHIYTWHCITLTLPAFPTLTENTASYTPHSYVSYPESNVLGILFHITLLKQLLDSVFIHVHIKQ